MTDANEWVQKHDIKQLDDDCYPEVFFGQPTEIEDEKLVTTHEQRSALFRKWKQDDQGKTWAQFAMTAHATFGMDGAIVVNWSGMWLAIETDGYTHS